MKTLGVILPDIEDGVLKADAVYLFSSNSKGANDEPIFAVQIQP
jgi:hypothetical protein